MTAERSQFLASIMASALDGGIDYWAEILTYNNKAYLSSGNTERLKAIVVDSQDESVRFVVDIDTIATGLARITDPARAMVSETRRATISAADRDSNATALDADLADEIVQAGLFDCVAFGQPQAIDSATTMNMKRTRQ